MKYLIRYGMGGSKPEDATFNVTTRNTSIVLTLSVPEGSPDMVVYNIWVAVVTESQEQGHFTMLQIQYSSKPGFPWLNVLHSEYYHRTMFVYSYLPQHQWHQSQSLP